MQPLETNGNVQAMASQPLTRWSVAHVAIRIVRGVIACAALGLFAQPAAAEVNLVWTCGSAASAGGSVTSCPAGAQWERGRVGILVASANTSGALGTGTWRLWEDVQQTQYVYTCMAEHYRISAAACSSEAYALKSFVGPVPAAKVATARLISPTAAASYFTASTSATNQLNLPRANEIVELSRALSNDPYKIIDYVRNNIEIHWSYGLQKGALGTFLDRHGTAFDQAHLAVELIRQAGYAANYEFGTFSVSAADFYAWSGVNTQRAACDLLSSGGIPAVVGTSGDSYDCSSIAAGTALPSSITLAHVWVTAQIGGKTYRFNPSYKAHTFRSGVNLTSQMGLTTGQVLNSASSGMQSGTASGVGYVSNLNVESINDTLLSYGTALLNYTQANPAVSIDDLVGAPDITWADQTIIPPVTTLPGGSASATWSAIPDQYRTRLRVELAKTFPDVNSPIGADRRRIIDQLLFVDEIYGRKLTVEPSHPVGSQTNVAPFEVKLLLSDRTATLATIAVYCTGRNSQTGACTAATDNGGMRDGTLRLTANHPYPASGTPGEATATGTYMDVVSEKAVFMFTPFTILHGWGYAGDGLAEAWGPRLDSPAPQIPSGEFGCDGCEQYYSATKGDGRREQMAASWMIQASRAARMHADIARAVYTHHHSLGVVSADVLPKAVDLIPSSDSPTYYVIADSFDRVDVDTAFSLTSKTTDTAQRRATVAAIAATTEALEGSVAEQAADLPDVSSTATRFEWGNRPVNGEDMDGGRPVTRTPVPRRFYNFNSGNSANSLALATVEGVTTNSLDGYIGFGGGEPEISNNEVGTRRAALSEAIKVYTQAGYSVVSAEDAFLGPGQRGGSFFTLTNIGGANRYSQQRGGALVATRYDANGDPVEIAHVLIGHDEMSKGGGGGTQSNQQAKYDPAAAADVLKARFVDRSDAIGVSLKKGTVTYEAPAKLAVGNGGFPYELSASLIWRGGNQVSETFGPIVHTQPLTPWTTNWHNTLNVSSSALEAMGASDPRAAAGAIAAFVAQQDVYKSAASAQRDVAAVLVSSWLMKQISGNVATVTVGADTRQFIRNVAGNWFSPGPNSYATLAQTGARAKFTQGCGEGYVTTRGWNYAGMAFKVTSSQGAEQNFSYWANDYYTAPNNTCGKMHGFRLSTWTFPQGMTVNLVYTPQGTGLLDRLTEVNNSLGRKIRFNYTSGANGSGRLSGFDNGLTGTELQSVVMTYDALENNVISIRDPSTNLTRFTTSLSSEEHRLEEIFDADDSSTVPSLRYTYDSLNRVKEARDAVALQAGPRNPHQFLIAQGGRGERIDPAGGRYTVLYDSHVRPFRHIDEIGRVSAIQYDGWNRVREYLYPDGDKQVLGYDARNNPTLMSHVSKGGNDSHDVTAQWHATWNKPLWIQDPNGNRTDFAYDESGNGRSLMNTATRPADQDGVRPVYTFTYNSRGQVLDSTDPTGLVTTNTYNSTNGNLATSGLPVINSISSFGYDTIGNQTSVTDPRAFVTEFNYDNNRRKVVTKNHGGDINAVVIAAQRTSYNSVGLVFKEEAGIGFSGTQVTQWQTLKDLTYTRNGQVETETNGAGETTTTSYDPMDRIQQLQDPLQRRTRFVYDLAGQVSQEIRAWGTALQQNYATYEYNPNGKRTAIIDAKNNRTEFRYNNFDRLTYIYYPVAAVGQNAVNRNDSEQYDYDRNGNRTLKITRDGKGIVSSLDALDREIYRNFPEGTGDTNVEIKYDLAGRPRWKHFGATGAGVDYGYDAAKRLTSETSYGRTMTYGYDLAGNRNFVQWPDANYVSYGFDAMNRMTEVRENSTSPGVNVLQTYAWDPLSRRSSSTPLTRSNGTSTSFAYDSASRLTGLGHDLGGTAQDFTLGFAYTTAGQLRRRTTTNDAIGWWVAPDLVHSYSVNGLNQYTAVSGATYTHDRNGNLTSDGSRTFVYDTENRLTSVAGTASMTLSYDPLGRLKQTVAGTSTTNFLYDGDRLVAEYNGAGTLLRRYVHGAGVDEPIVWYEGAGTSTKSWMHTDERGSIVASTSTSGQATSYQYGPYGEQASWSGSRFRYTGQIMLPDAQLYHYKSRVYDPKIGRFLQTDPIGYEDGLNIYAYVYNDPLNRQDPTGRDSASCYTVSGCGGGIVPTQHAVDLAIGLTPVLGDAKGIADAWRDPSLLNVSAAVVGLGGPLGDAAKVGLKQLDNLGDVGQTLYRVVDGKELADIVETGAFKAAPNGDSVKRFLGNLPDAKALKEKFEAFFKEAQHIVEGHAPQEVIDSAQRTQFNDVGRAMESVAIPNEQLDKVKVICTGSRIARESC